MRERGAGVRIEEARGVAEAVRVEGVSRIEPHHAGAAEQGGAQRRQEAAGEIARPGDDVVARRDAAVLEQRPEGLCSGERGFGEGMVLRERHPNSLVERMFDVKTQQAAPLYRGLFSHTIRTDPVGL